MEKKILCLFLYFWMKKQTRIFVFVLFLIVNRHIGKCRFAVSGFFWCGRKEGKYVDRGCVWGVRGC